VDVTTLVGVAYDYLVSGCAQALVARNPFSRAVRLTLEDCAGATSGKTKITLRQKDTLVQHLVHQ
jgi:hypothetical protein